VHAYNTTIRRKCSLSFFSFLFFSFLFFCFLSFSFSLFLFSSSFPSFGQAEYKWNWELESLGEWNGGEEEERKDRDGTLQTASQSRGRRSRVSGLGAASAYLAVLPLQCFSVCAFSSSSPSFVSEHSTIGSKASVLPYHASRTPPLFFFLHPHGIIASARSPLMIWISQAQQEEEGLWEMKTNGAIPSASCHFPG
jgi:hypothetical protein